MHKDTAGPCPGKRQALITLGGAPVGRAKRSVPAIQSCGGHVALLFARPTPLDTRADCFAAEWMPVSAQSEILMPASAAKTTARYDIDAFLNAIGDVPVTTDMQRVRLR